MRVSLLQVVAAARLREASLAAESAGYILLAVVDQVAAAPRRVTLAGVDLGEEGKLRLSTAEPCDEQAAELELRALLEQLLRVASSSTPALQRVARHAEPAGLGGLGRELEAALIPVNRAAAQRALARLVRETARAVERGLEVEEEVSKVESPLVAALLVTPAPSPVPRRPPAVSAPPVTLREVSSPAPPVAFKIAVDAPPAPIPPLEMPAIQALRRMEPMPEQEARPAQALEPVVTVETVLTEELDVDVEVELELEPERSPREAETRPEPVILRSVAPPAPPAALGSPLETPRLGTLVAPSTVFQEVTSEHELTERMPPVALLEEAPEAGAFEDQRCSSEMGDQAKPAPIEEERVEAPIEEERVEAPAELEAEAPAELEAGAPAELEAEAAAELEAEAPAELEAAGELEAFSIAIELLDAEAHVEALPEPLDESDIIVEESPLELAFTPSPHPPASVTLEALRGPNYEPEPDYEPEPLPEYEPEPEPEPTPPSLPRVQLRREPLRSDIEDLLRGFRNEAGPTEPELSRELRILAGLELTPPPTTAGER